MGPREDTTRRDVARAADEPALQPGAASPAPRPLSVLLIDDNTDLVLMIAMGLRREGYIVRTAGSGFDGLNAAENFRPDVVLLDIGLPGIDGYDVACQLRARPGMEGVRFIAVTGYAEETDTPRARESAFDAHLLKPYEFDDLLKLLVAPSG